MHLSKGSFYPAHSLGDKAGIGTGMIPKYVCQLEEQEGNDVLLGEVVLQNGDFTLVKPQLMEKNFQLETAYETR